MTPLTAPGRVHPGEAFIQVITPGAGIIVVVQRHPVNRHVIRTPLRNRHVCDGNFRFQGGLDVITERLQPQTDDFRLELGVLVAVIDGLYFIAISRGHLGNAGKRRQAEYKGHQKGAGAKTGAEGILVYFLP